MTDTITTPAEALEAAVDHWQAWLDDLPLPEGFSTGATELQEFLRALSARIAAPVALKPDTPVDTAAQFSEEVSRRLMQEPGFTPEAFHTALAVLSKSAAHVQAEALEAAARYRVQSSTEAWLICTLADALSDRIAAPVAVVKPLEWREARLSDKYPRFSAESPFGDYEALQWATGDFGGSFPNTEKGEENIEFGKCHSIEAAKAAAQADYEARILSALTIQPAAQAVVQPDRATFDAMCAMRDAINEYVPMPSLESDLLQGPENSVFCATVAEAVIAEIVRLRSIQPAAHVQAEALEAAARYRVQSSTEAWLICTLADALSARIAEPEIMRCAECDCEAGGESCNWIASPSRIAAPVAVEPVLHEHYADNAPWEDGWTLDYGPGGATTVKHIGSTNGSTSSVAIYSLQEGMIAFAKAHALTVQLADQAVDEALAGAFIAAAERALSHRDYDSGGGYWDGVNDCANSIAKEIAASTPADATAAIARRDAEVRKAALRDAIGALKRAGLPDAALHVLALIDKEPAHG